FITPPSTTYIITVSLHDALPIFTADGWCHATLMTQWEVARKRAGVGGVTMMTAQVVPWFEIRLHGRVPSWGFTPKPSVDGGVIRSEEHTSELQSRFDLVCRLLLE